MRLISKPLFSVDPGWLFVLSGLGLLISGALVPMQRDLHELRDQLRVVHDRESESFQRLRAYAAFMEDLDEHEPTLVRRLAASQLNLMPKGSTAVLVSETLDAGVTDWIEATVDFKASEPEPFPDTLLTRLALGPRRLWLLAGGALSVFAGLMLGPGLPTRASRRRQLALPPAEVESMSVAGLLTATVNSEADDSIGLQDAEWSDNQSAGVVDVEVVGDDDEPALSLREANELLDREANDDGGEQSIDDTEGLGVEVESESLESDLELEDIESDDDPDEVEVESGVAQGMMGPGEVEDSGAWESESELAALESEECDDDEDDEEDLEESEDAWGAMVPDEVEDSEAWEPESEIEDPECGRTEEDAPAAENLPASVSAEPLLFDLKPDALGQESAPALGLPQPAQADDDAAESKVNPENLPAEDCAVAGEVEADDEDLAWPQMSGTAEGAVESEPRADYVVDTTERDDDPDDLVDYIEGGRG